MLAFSERSILEICLRQDLPRMLRSTHLRDRSSLVPSILQSLASLHLIFILIDMSYKPFGNKGDFTPDKGFKTFVLDQFSF